MVRDAAVAAWHVFGGKDAMPPARRILYADGSAGASFRPDVDLELSHWVPTTTPARWAADTSTETCLRFATDPPDEARFDLAVNNHVDVDGILSLFALARTELATRHHDVVVAAAEMGDLAAGVERAAFRLAQELALVVAEAVRAGADPNGTYAAAFDAAAGVLDGTRREAEAVARGWAALERGHERIASGEVQVVEVAPRLVSFVLPRLRGDDLVRALRVSPFNPVIDDSVWLWPHVRNRARGEAVHLVSIPHDGGGWFHDLWLPGYVWARTPGRWAPPGLESTGDSNAWRVAHPPLAAAIGVLAGLEASAAGRWTAASELTPFRSLVGRGFPVVASFVDAAGAPASSSLEPASVAAVLAPVYAPVARHVA